VIQRDVHRLDRPHFCYTWNGAKGGDLQAAALWGDRLIVAGYMGRAYALSGRTEAARQLISQLQRSPQQRYPVELAQVYASLGETDRAIDSLEQMLSAGYTNGLDNVVDDPTFDSLVDHPRYRALLERAQSQALATSNGKR
jgi:hypothetical protein